MKSYFEFKESLDEETAIESIVSGKDADAFEAAVDKGNKKAVIAMLVKHGDSKSDATKQATQLLKVHA
jgi:hypothetical protein|tara:strand:+ start:8266 stop:8469 length:204 start_codon:yes stop_codon:yes gene_type:complete